MKNKLVWLIGALVVLIMVSYMFSYQVAYNEVAVLATFGKAGENSVKDEAGLHFRLPPPFQSVYSYSKKLQLIETQLDEVNTKDNFTVILRSYMTWKVENPLEFYRELKEVSTASNRFAVHLSNTDGIIGKYNFAQLVNTDSTKLKLEEIEQAALMQLRGELSQYGVHIEQVGIRRIVLSEAVTTDVFNRMKDNRINLASGILARGEAEASSIISEAQSKAARIASFADNYASRIRTQGDMEASQYYEAFNKNEEFAVFVRRIETLKAILAKRTTFVIDADTLSPFDLLNTEPMVEEKKK